MDLEKKKKHKSWLEILSRIVIVPAFLYFCLSTYLQIKINYSPVLVLLLCTEIINILLILTAKFSENISRNKVALISTIIGTFYFLFIKTGEGQRLLPEMLCLSLQIFGISFQILAKFWLGRAFGLLPAYRGKIVSTGPYKIVRHPIYLGYFLTHLGFLMALFSFYNLIIYSLLYVFQIVRILEEEKLLAVYPDYQVYMKSVKKRFLPFIF